ncbi:MAG: hypothetical protein KC657_05365 [Myxococcales bacterium]|nr:hypothetical protein [Myxococcales bacterium]
MGFEYKIRFAVPASLSCESLAARLPDPRAGASRAEYDFALVADGFYFVDHGRSPAASVAFRLLVDEALRHAAEVVIEEL